ncbi:MAG: histidine phosphatase family protein [Myxococcales bacterium]|nr:histidine phosphatase family protein [Myxococcales bacterium]
MSTLLLIRHGQASLRGADYDVLSDLGVEQARLLGAHLGRRGEAFDVIASGPLRRQRETAEHLRATAAAAGLALPEVLLVPELDEMPALEILARCVPDLAARDPEIAELAAAQAIAREREDPRTFRRAFEFVFQAMMRRWVDGAFADAGIETYAAFQARVERGIDRLFELGGRGSRIAAVTSAGTIGAAVRAAFTLQPWDAMRATFVVANASLTELKHRPGELTLATFNALPHLDRPELRTLR